MAEYHENCRYCAQHIWLGAVSGLFYSRDSAFHVFHCPEAPDGFHRPRDVTVISSAEEAFGRPVPTERQVAALDVAIEVLGVHPLDADPVIQEAALRINRDEPDKALIVLRNIVDLTGAYRLLAVLCTAPITLDLGKPST